MPYSERRYCTVCGRVVRIRYEGSSTIPRLPEGWTADTVNGVRCPEHCVTEPLRAFLDWFAAHALDHIPNDVYHRTGGYELLRAVEAQLPSKDAPPPDTALS